MPGHGWQLLQLIRQRGATPVLFLTAKDAHDFRRQTRVEVTGGFIGQQQGRTMHDGAGNADALLLAGGQVARVEVGLVRQRHALQGRIHALDDLGLGQPEYLQRQRHVIEHGAVEQQLVVQYGTPALTNNNPQQFRNVVSFSFSLDIVSGAVAIVGGIALLPFLSHSLGLDDQSFWLAALYCTLIPSMASSTPTGILRAVDRFDLIAVQQATKPFLRAAGSVVAWYFDFGFAGFVIAWYVSNLVGGTMYWWFAVRELRRRNIHNAFKLNLFESARHIKGAWSFVWSTNIAHSIWSARNSCSTVLVGIVLGPAAAGLFKIAMTFFDAAGTPAGLLGKSFYPEVMRLDPRTTRPWLLGVKSGLLAGGIGILVALAVLIVGKPLISLVFGVKYLEAYDLIQVMLGAIVISMLGFPQESLLLMAGKQRAFLVAQTIASIGYIVLLFMFCHLFGVSRRSLAGRGAQQPGAGAGLCGAVVSGL